MRCGFKAFIFFALFSLATALCSSFSFAQERVETFIFKVDAPVLKLSLLVYANGDLVGLAPGVVGLPLRESGTAVQIGVPQLASLPLFSFVISDAEISNGYVDMEVSSLNKMDHIGESIWESFVVSENYIERVYIEETKEGYVISIPKGSYEKVGSEWEARKINPYSSSWFGEGIRYNNSDPTSYAHWRLNEVTTGIPEKSYSEYWTGAFQSSGVGITEKREWNVSSVPDGAKVHNEEGYIAATVFQKNIPSGANSFLIFQMPGHRQIVYECLGRDGCEDISECRKWKEGDVRFLQCAFQ